MLLAFGLAARRAHLQVLRGNAVVAGLRRLQKSEHRTGRRGATQRIDGSVGWQAECLQALPERT